MNTFIMYVLLVHFVCYYDQSLLSTELHYVLDVVFCKTLPWREGGWVGGREGERGRGRRERGRGRERVGEEVKSLVYTETEKWLLR